MAKIPLPDTENYTGKNRRRAQKVAGHHRNTLSAVMGQFQHARRVRFLEREASGYDRRSSPKKQIEIIPENWEAPNR